MASFKFEGQGSGLTGAVDGSNPVFTTSQPYVTGSVRLFWNGNLTRGGHAETDSGAGTVTLNFTPPSGDTIDIYYEVQAASVSSSTGAISVLLNGSTTFDLLCKVGQDESDELTFFDVDGDPLDLTGCTITIDVKTALSATSNTLSFLSSDATQIAIATQTGANIGKATWYRKDTDTVDIDEGRFVWGLKLTFSSGSIKQLVAQAAFDVIGSI